MQARSIQVREYLLADGYTIVKRPSELAEREISAWRPGPGGIRQHMNIWMPTIPDGGTLETQEGNYRGRFERARELHPTATNIMLVPSREGIRPAFIQESRRTHGVRVQTPIEFFDATFAWEGNVASATIGSRLRDEGVRVDQERIKQPFTGGFSNGGDDLVDDLFRRFRDRRLPASIHIVQGPAGIGKSWLFCSLFARLYNAFIQDKRERRTLWARPLPLVPEYDPTGRRLSDLLSAFIRTEVDRPMRREVLDWLVANGHGVLMLDGLEEVMALDEAFTDRILEYFTLPFTDGQPTVLICLRDSLMNRNQAVIDFCTEYSDRTTVYNLEKWDDKCIRSFADRTIPKGESRSKFITTIQSDETLHDIASLPYLCGLLAQEFNDGRLTDTLSLAQLMENAVKAIITREYGKKLALTEEVMPIDDVLTFAQDLAQKDMEGGFNGVSPSEINEWAKDWAELVWPEEIEERGRFELQMSQIAFFEQGAAGRLKFVHEILELYLIGRKYIECLKRRETGYFIDALSHWEFPTNSIMFDILSGYCTREIDQAAIEDITVQSLNMQKALKNMLQLLSNSGFDCRFLGRNLVRKDLSGLKFVNVSFRGVSFAGCNLDAAEFQECDLRDTEFSGAIISNTGFFNMPSSMMQGANFGDINTVHSIRVGGRSGPRNIGQTKAAMNWLRGRAKVVSGATVDELPCPASQQLRHLFGKFIRSDGTARRTWVGEDVIYKGSKHIQRPKQALEAAVRTGYLTLDKGFNRYRRTDSPGYSEMVDFVKRLDASPDIRFLLDDLCGNKSCARVLG